MSQLQEKLSESDGTELDRLRQEVEDLRNRKGVLSRQVGEARRAGVPSESLIAELKQISDRYKTLSKTLKSRLNADASDPARTAPSDHLPSMPWPDAQVQVQTISHELGNPDLAGAWDRFVMSHPLASPYHLLSVRQAVESAFGHRTHYLCALGADGQVIGVLPLVQLNSRLFGNFVVSMPFFNYGGVLANNADTAQQLVQSAGEWADQVGARHLEMRHLEASGLELPSRQEKVSFWLTLPKDPEQLWRSFKPKVRAQIRRPAELNPQVCFGGEELLGDFYQVFAQNMRDLGTPVYGKIFFREMLRARKENAELVVVYLAGKPVGCAFLLGFRERMEIPWASTLRETNSIGINMLMYWEVLRHTIGKGYEVFDFGRCSVDSGTYRFKQQWGAQPLPLVWEYRLAPGQALPALNPDNPKFRLLIAIWKRLPVWATRILGPSIVRNLP